MNIDVGNFCLPFTGAQSHQFTDVSKSQKEFFRSPIGIGVRLFAKLVWHSEPDMKGNNGLFSHTIKLRHCEVTAYEMKGRISKHEIEDEIISQTKDNVVITERFEDAYIEYSLGDHTQEVYTSSHWFVQFNKTLVLLYVSNELDAKNAETEVQASLAAIRAYLTIRTQDQA